MHVPMKQRARSGNLQPTLEVVAAYLPFIGDRIGALCLLLPLHRQPTEIDANSLSTLFRIEAERIGAFVDDVIAKLADFVRFRERAGIHSATAGDAVQ